MIIFTGGPFDGEEVEDELYPFDEIHIQRYEDEPVYIYEREPGTLNFEYVGEFADWEVHYKEDEDEDEE